MNNNLESKIKYLDSIFVYIEKLTNLIFSSSLAKSKKIKSLIYDLEKIESNI